MVFAHRPPGVLRFVAIMAGAIDLALGVMLVVLSVQSPQARDLLIGGIVLIVTCWLPPWILLGVRYEVEPSELIVRRGPIARRIALASVDEVRIAAPIPGLQGVIVTYRRKLGRSALALYPETPTEFLRQIAMQAPHLHPQGEGTLRTSGS